VLLSRHTNRNYSPVHCENEKTVFLFQKYISEIMLIELTRKKTRLSRFKRCAMSVSDDVIEAGNIMTARCEKDFPLLSTEPCGYHDFCAAQTDFPV